VSRHPAEQDPEHEAERNPDQPDRHRDPGTVDQPRQDVAAEAVRAEQIDPLPRIGRSEEVEVGLDLAPESVRLTADEEAQWDLRLRIHGEDAPERLPIDRLLQTVDVRPDE